MVDYLIIGRSGRALAESAVRAGYKVCVADNFADEDTKSFSESVHQLQYHDDGFEVDELLNHTQNVISRYPNAKLVLGSGFEQKPELIDKLAAIAPLLGNSEETIVALKNPEFFFRMLEQHSIQYPETLFSKPIDSNPKKYLMKTIAGIGGGHVNWSKEVEPDNSRDCYFQEYVSGLVSSVVFLTNGTEAKIVGFNQQLQSNEFNDMPFLYLGAMSVENVSEQHRQTIYDIINKISKETSLKGLCGLDYIVNEAGEVIVLEVNPRPPATFELHEEQQSLFEAHLACFDGKLFESDNQDRKKKTYKAYAILYAKENSLISDKVKWPLWVKDKPKFASVIPAKFPVCTVHAEENSLDKVKTILFNRLQQIESMIVAMQNAA